MEKNCRYMICIFLDQIKKPLYTFRQEKTIDLSLTNTKHYIPSHSVSYLSAIFILSDSYSLIHFGNLFSFYRQFKLFFSNNRDSNL